MSRNEIDIHPGRVAIYNPGSFPEGLSPEDFLEKDMPSKIRNELICKALYKCNMIESWSTGFKKVCTSCDEAGVELSYEKETDGFWFFFKRKNGTNVTANVTTNDLTELEKMVLQELSTNSHATREALSEKIGRTSRHIQRTLDSLKAKGLIRRNGSNKNGYWEVLK